MHIVRQPCNLLLQQQTTSESAAAWPVKRAAEIAGGDLVVGGLHMVHEREASALTCGPVMPQGGLQGRNSTPTKWGD